MFPFAYNLYAKIGSLLCKYYSCIKLVVVKTVKVTKYCYF